MNGYEIARQCEKDTGVANRMSNGALYRTLKNLKVRGFIDMFEATPELRPGKPAVYYRITASGMERLGTILLIGRSYLS